MLADSNYSDYKELTPKRKGYYIYVKCRKGDTDVVLKALKPEYRDKKVYQDALAKEYEIACKMDHANIVKYQDFIDTEDYGKCIELEYVEARPLKEYFCERHTEEEKVAIVEQLAGALEYIHNLKIVHGGVNNQNILITNSNNRVKLCNFRTISSLELDDFESVKYIAPEQKDNGSVYIDQRADIYSVGVVLKDLGFWPAYEGIIKKCIALGRNDRYDTCEEFLSDFDQDDSGIHIDKKWIVAVLAAAVVAAAVYFIVSSGILQNIKMPSFEEKTETLPADTVPSSEINPHQQVEKKDTASVAKAAGAASDPIVESVKHGLDSVFAPYLEKKDEGLNNQERKGLRQQTKGLYRKLLRDNEGITTEDRQKLDEIFSSYAKELKAQFPYGVEPRYEKKKETPKEEEDSESAE